MNKKIVFLLEVCFIVGALLYYTVKVMIPEYRSSTGSSDYFIQSSHVDNIIEIKIDNHTNFAIIINKKAQIEHLFFFDNSSVSLYNKNIESQSLETGLEKMVPILIENDLLKNQSQIEIIRMNDNQYKEFQRLWKQTMNKYSISRNEIEKKREIKEKAFELGIEEESFTTMLLEIDFYSKEIVKENEDIYTGLNEKNSVEYADTVYRKLDQMIQNNRMASSNEKEEIILTMIAADNNKKYYPTSHSWYEIKNGKVYAFIELKDHDITYSYCYKGSIESRVKGDCQNE